MPVAHPDEPCYIISIVAELVQVHPQTLRRYEEVGLVRPARVSGRRLYSHNDVERLRRISRLTEELGVNLAGVDVILRLTEQLEEVYSEMAQLKSDLEEEIRRRHCTDHPS